MERSTIFNGKIHYKWPFSIAMLNYQRVMVLFEGVMISPCIFLLENSILTISGERMSDVEVHFEKTLQISTLQKLAEENDQKSTSRMERTKTT